MNWPSILQTILVGTDRRKLPAETASEQQPGEATDPVAAALEALSRVALLKKGGFQPAVHIVSQVFPLQEEEDPNRPYLSEPAIGFLQRMLEGTYREGLPEFLDLLEQGGYRLPPELLPGLLDQCMQQAAVAARMIPLMGERGRWLARQNVRWYPLSADPDASDWFTATSDVRKQLLAATRKRNPMLALAWLEKTWAEEKADDKVAFLHLLKSRLSTLDLDLLERAFQDKNREVRLAALDLLTLLPDNPVRSSLETFFSNKLAGALPLAKREKYLQTTLPDLAADELKPWFDLLSKTEKADWRNGLLHLFIRYLPPEEMCARTGLKPAEIVVASDLGNQTALAESLLENLLRRSSAEWTDAIWQHYCKLFRHALWQKPAMQAFMSRNVESLMQHLAGRHILLDYDSQFLLRSLENYRQPWSKQLLNNLLQQYRSAVSGNMPGWHYAAALQTAAWHCDLPDGHAAVQAAYSSSNAYQPKEWTAFMNIVRYRHSMHAEIRREK